METLNDIIPRARAFKLRSSELTDSTITLTSVGENGADSVLWHNLSAAGGNRGFRDNFRTAFAEKGMLAIRSVVKVTLAGDHRATDGLIGSHF
jgi:pyruvate dehydrogenase E2 component (dihydrolipoamide acetyltransferase)